MLAGVLSPSVIESPKVMVSLGAIAGMFSPIILMVAPVESFTVTRTRAKAIPFVLFGFVTVKEQKIVLSKTVSFAI